MNRVLVGNTGLVGKTLSENIDFTHTFNTKNIHEFSAVVEDGAEIYLSCLPAAKWLVNKDLPKDIDNINGLIRILSTKQYSRIVLLSTIDVYNQSPLGSNEDYMPNVGNLSYGNNRYLFELFVRSFLKTKDLKIFRLPALFNKHIKKNILFDLLNNNNVQNINPNSAYQWYNLDNLADDIQENCFFFYKETVFNLFPEPVETSDITSMFNYQLDPIQPRIQYDYKTKYTSSGYIKSKQESLEEIKTFINATRYK